MNCPDPHDLALFLEKSLPAEDAEKIQSHVETCDECQAVIGAPGDYVLSPPSRTSDIELAAEWAKIRPLIERAYESAAEWPADDSDLEDEEAMPLALAADDKQSPALDIPSLHAGNGRILVKFNTEPETERVTAYVIATDPEWVRHRPLRLGERIYLSDVDGRIDLGGMTATQVLGMRTELPDPLVTGQLDFTGPRRDDPTPQLVRVTIPGRDDLARGEVRYSAELRQHVLDLVLSTGTPASIGVLVGRDQSPCATLVVGGNHLTFHLEHPPQPGNSLVIY